MNQSPQLNPIFSLPLPLPQLLPLFPTIQKSLRYCETIPEKGNQKSLVLPNYRQNLHLRLNSVKQVSSNGKKAEHLKFLHRMHTCFIVGNTLKIVS